MLTRRRTEILRVLEDRHDGIDTFYSFWALNSRGMISKKLGKTPRHDPRRPRRIRRSVQGYTSLTLTSSAAVA